VTISKCMILENVVKYEFFVLMKLSELIRCPFVLHQCHVLFKEITPHSIVHRQSQVSTIK
jgi:hypothetical protein